MESDPVDKTPWLLYPNDTHDPQSTTEGTQACLHLVQTHQIFKTHNSESQMV